MVLTLSQMRRLRRQRASGRFRQQGIISHCRQPDGFMRKTFLFSSGRRFSEVRYTLEPGGKFVRPRFAQEALESGRLIPRDGDLFGDPNNAQTWITRSPTPEEESARSSLRKLRSAPNHPNAKESTMDMREFLKPTYITVDELKTGGRISGALVVSSQRGKKYDKPELTVEVGGLPRLVGLNKKSLQNLCKAWGAESDGWVDSLVDIDLGVAQFNDDDVDSIVIEPTPEPAETAESPPTPPKKRRAAATEPPVDDEVPF